MPPKLKSTREGIAATAFEIIKQEGSAAVSNSIKSGKIKGIYMDVEKKADGMYYGQKRGCDQCRKAGGYGHKKCANKMILWESE